MPSLLLELGANLQDVLEAADVRADIFDDPENLISYQQAGRLLAVSARLTHCDHLGLLIGQRSRLCNMGLAGQLALCMDTAGAGLQSFADYFTLQNTAATVSLVSQGGFSRFVYAVVEPDLRDTEQLQLGAMALAFNILQDLCGTDFLPTVVTFATATPTNLRRFHRFFSAPLRFDSEETALVFETRWLDRPLPPVEASWRRRIEADARARQAAAMADFPMSIRRTLRRQLAKGDFSMQSIASLLGMHRRTLDRRLKEHGTQYGDLLDSVQCDAACQLLRDTELQVRQVAESLHYSNTANFSTAFRRWTGLTPSAYRKQSRPPSRPAGSPTPRAARP